MCALTCLFKFRNEIASCSEKAYTCLPLADAATLLFFDNRQDVMTFAMEVRMCILLVITIKSS